MKVKQNTVKSANTGISKEMVDRQQTIFDISDIISNYDEENKLANYKAIEQKDDIMFKDKVRKVIWETNKEMGKKVESYVKLKIDQIKLDKHSNTKNIQKILKNLEMQKQETKLLVMNNNVDNIQESRLKQVQSNTKHIKQIVDQRQEYFT